MYEFKFPDVGEGIAEGEVLRWLVEAGQKVREHQPLVEMETDKAIVELPSPVNGKVAELKAGVGELVPVGAVLALIEESAAKEKKAEAEKASEPVRDAGGVVGQLEEAPEAAETEKPQAPSLLPKDRKLAKELGVELSAIRGSGPGGRILEEDIRAAAGKKEPEAERIPLKGVRRSMAKAMVASHSSAVQVSILDRADGLALSRIRQQEEAMASRRGIRLSWLPFIAKAVCLALERFPLLNSSLDEEKGEIVLHPKANLGFAVDTPGGLLVPVVRDARSLSILELSETLSDLARRARDRSVRPGELKGGTFTLTNYGALGGLWGTPILNPPQAAILGVGRIEDAPAVREGQLVIRPLVPLSLSFDHRIIDGATAQRFLNCVIEHIEDPNLILLET